MDKHFLETAVKQFEYYKQLAEKTFEQLEEKQWFELYNSESNSIAFIVQHMSGNMLSRWTHFLTQDGEKEWRNRDLEFEQNLQTKAAVLNYWNKGWECLFDALNNLQESDFDKIIYIRNQGHTITEAIARQLAHYPYHIGQIVFIGKMMRNEKWQSLSIPKNKSQSYNDEKFAQPKVLKHFTDEK